MQNIDLYKWVNEANQGQQTAWSFLYNFFHPYLYSQALAIFGNTPAAKDAVQDTFLIAFLQLNKLKDPLAFPAWIKKILIHHCYRNIQKEKRMERPDHFLGNGSDMEFEKKLDELYNKHKLFDSLDALPEHLRTTVLLRYFSKKNTYDDIAALLCVPIGTIRSRLNKARIELSRYWKESCAEGSISQESEEWNAFYLRHFEGYAINLQLRERIFNHLENDLHLQLTSGKHIIGKTYMVKGLEADVDCGVRLKEINVISCGKISVIEFDNINSKEYPDHCPPKTTLVAFREKKKLVRMHLHDADAKNFL
jgi:RNA polymerase sigma factor (sigma-70 family)